MNVARCVGFLIIALALIKPTIPGLAQSSIPKNVLEAVFGSQAPPHITRVVVVRIDPWIARVIDATPHLFELGQAEGDRQAIVRDSRGVQEIEDRLLGTVIISRSEGCYGRPHYTAEGLPVSWAVFFYTGETGATKVGAIYLDASGLCASTGTHLFNVDPQTLSTYLKRTFGFMNY